MRDVANTPSTTTTPAPTAALRRRVGPPAGPRSAGLAVVLPPPAALVVDLDAHRARTAAPALVVVVDGPRPAAPEEGLSIQDRVRLRALEAAERR